MKHVFWFLDRVHGFVTERHIHSQAVREMNAHTVQHGSLGVFTFLSFVVFLLFCKPESIQHNPRIWVGGIYRSGSDEEEDVLERSLKVRIFPRKKQSPPVRSEIDAGSRRGEGEMSEVVVPFSLSDEKQKIKLTLDQIFYCKLLYSHLTGGSYINVFFTAWFLKINLWWNQTKENLEQIICFHQSEVLISSMKLFSGLKAQQSKKPSHTDWLLLTSPTVHVWSHSLPWFWIEKIGTGKETGFPRLLNSHYIQETHRIRIEMKWLTLTPCIVKTRRKTTL